MSIHPTAVVHPESHVEGVEIGPFAVIEAGVSVGAGTRIGPHCVVHTGTTIGADCTLSAHVVLGGAPQDLKHDAAAESTLTIGDRNVFREFSTAHRGTSGGRGATVVGHDNYFMANSHVAHDCMIGNHVMFANSVAIAGHVIVEDHAILGGLAAVHQHCRIGRLSMVGGGAMCAQDVPPFTIAQGDRARLYGLNIIGLRRNGYTLDSLGPLKEAWRLLFTEGLARRTAVSRVRAAYGDRADVAELLDFVEASERGVCRAGVTG